MTGRTNPTPRLRYSYSNGSIPDFSIEFGISGSDDEQTVIFSIGSQSYSLTTEQYMEYLQSPYEINLLYGYIYADEHHLLTFNPEGGFPAFFSIENGTLTPLGYGMSGTVSTSNGVMTITFTTSPDIEETSFTIDLSNEEWCYYADENGGYGLYFYDQFDEGLYIGNEPICPSAVYASELTHTVAILYNGGKHVTSGEMPTHLRFVTDVDENGVITYAYWTADESLTYPAKVYILPISLEPELSILKIPITYDATTRRISLDTKDNYGGATTDVDSVKLMFTGIEPFGDNFVARVDFAVPVKTDEYTVEHPFILLDPTDWSAVIPNAVLAATKDTRKLPFQLVLANDSQVINSRNAIVLETTLGIDSVISDLPEYEMPEWPLPTGVSESIDVHTVEVAYDPETRVLTASRDPYGGATIDTNSVRVNITGIEPIGTDFGARLDFAVPIRYDEEQVIKPFVVLEQIGTTYSAMIPQAVLMAAKETKKLPFQLVTRHGDTIINSRNTVVLEITRAINAMESVYQVYAPYVMYRNDTWEWAEDFTYDTGAVVVYNGELFSSLTDHNKGNVPNQNTDKWFLLTGIENVVLDDIHGTRVGSEITFTSNQVFTAAGFTKTPVTVTELDAPVCSYEFPAESYTNEGYPLIEALHFGDLITGNDKFVMTNYDYGNDRRTANIYLYRYYGNEDRYDLLASMDANSIYHSGGSRYIPLIVSSQIVVIWRLLNDTAPQGNSIRVYDFLNDTCGEYGLAYEGEVSPGENRYGELNIVFNGTSSEEQIQINITRQYDQAQYEFGMSYDSTSYCWCPMDNTFVGMHHSYGYESDYIPMHWKDKGFALLSDSDAAIYADLNEGQIISTITDFEPAYAGQYPSYLYEFMTIDDPSVIKTIECVGAVTEGSITSVNATGWWHMDPDPEGWWDPDMPQGCVYKVANLTDPDVGSYDMYVGFEMYILPHRIEENTEGQ